MLRYRFKMGVPGLFNLLVNKFLVPVHPIVEHPICTEGVLCIDANALLHTSAAKIYKESHPSDLLVFREVCREVERMLKRFQPRHLLFAVDGVAGRAKQKQQRARRYLADSKKRNGKYENGYNTNAISPYTRFMMEFDTFFCLFKAEAERKYQVEIEYSSYRDPGEGEHKIVGQLQQARFFNLPIYIVGADADLILLSLHLQQKLYELQPNYFPSIRLVREEVILDIKDVRIYYLTRLRRANPRQMIDDLLVIYALFGNDFLPRMLDIYSSNIDIIHSIYANFEEGVTINGTVHIENLKRFLTKLRPHITPLVDTTKESNGYEYVRGLDWVLRFYTQGIPSWRWEYKEYYPPSIEEILQIRFPHEGFHWREGHPDPPYVQLARILPPTSSGLLPAKLRHVFTHHSNRIVQDSQFSNGRDYQNIVILDPLDEGYINSVVG